jgi:hypothetical protein
MYAAFTGLFANGMLFISRMIARTENGLRTNRIPTSAETLGRRMTERYV